MIVRDFRVETDPDYGGLGLKPRWMQNANAFDARAAAHDVLEHDLNEPGAAEGELMAMGSCCFIRGLTGWFQRRYPHNVNTPEEHIGSDVQRVMREVRFGDQTLTDPGRTRRIGDEDVDSFIDAVLHEGCRSWNGEMKYAGEDENTHPIEREELRRIQGWLRIGYRRAQRRYGAIGGYAASYLFDHIEAKLKPHVCEENLGCRITVKVDVPRESAIVIPHYDDD